MILDEQETLRIADALASGDDAKRTEADARLRIAQRDANDVLFRASKLAYGRAQQNSVVIVWVASAWLLVLLTVGKAFERLDAETVLFVVLLATFALPGLGNIMASAARSEKQRSRRIALQLERRGDLRAVKPLLDVWVPVVTGRTKNDDTTPAEVEAALGRVLLFFVAQTGLPLDGDQMARLRNKLDGVFPTRGKGKRVTPDFSDRCADILVTLMQLLARSPELPDRALVARIAAHPADLPNRVLVQTAARDCLEAAERSRNAHKSPTLVAPPLPTVGVASSAPASQTAVVRHTGGRP